MTKSKAKVNELKSALDKFTNEKTRAEILLTQKENELNQAKNAAEKIKLVEGDYQKHIDALLKLKEFERERGEREKLNVEQRKIETAQINVFAEQKRLQENLETAQRGKSGNRQINAAFGRTGNARKNARRFHRANRQHKIEAG